MENRKVQKSFIQRHKRAIMVVGFGFLAGTSIYGAKHIYNKILFRGYMTGGFEGFNTAIKWLNETFPDIKVKELYDEWVNLHPEQLVGLKDIL